MLYATRADLEARFNAEEIAVLEQTVGDGGVQQALQDAAEEAASYVAVRYAAPLPSVPAPLSMATCDIARFRLYKDRPTEEVKYRYEQAIKWLEKLAAGKVTIFFEPAVAPAEIPRAPVAIGVQYTGGVFGSAVLDRMPGIDVP